MSRATNAEEPLRGEPPTCGCDAALPNLLCCPETSQSLLPASQTLVQELNEAIKAGHIKSRNGKEVRENMEGGLLRADGKVLYPIRHNIPIMLVDESISLPSAQR